MTAAKAEKSSKSSKAPKKIVRHSPAVDLLERGIKHLFDKEYKAARSSFQAILDKHAEEQDVCVRAASFVKTCEMFIAPPHFSPSNAEEFYNQGIISHNAGDYDEAIRCFNEALKHDAKADYLYFALAASHAFKNDMPTVLKNLERAIKINPDNLAYAKNDPDFDLIRKEAEFAELLEKSPDSK